MIKAILKILAFWAAVIPSAVTFLLGVIAIVGTYEEKGILGAVIVGVLVAALSFLFPYLLIHKNLN